MSERIFGTEKVDKIIGLKDQKVYDKIDVFVDITNNNNLWGIIYYTEYKNRKPIQKQEIVRFQDNKTMIEYLKTNFDCYELNHPVDVNYKKIFFHYVDYCDINYYYHDGRPEKNYITLKIIEYINNTKIVNNMRFPKEYEDILVNVLKVNKQIPGVLGPKYHRDIEVYEERANERKEIIKSITISIEDFFKLSGDKIKKIVSNKKLIKGIKVFVSSAALTTLLANGYNIVMDNEFNSDYLVQQNPIKNVQDIDIYINKGKVGVIIEKLVKNQYEDITPDDMKYVINYIKKINDSNFDNNGSFNSFSFMEYFNNKLDYHINYNDSSNVLKKIEDLYNNCFKTINGKVTLVKSNFDKYITYVASLTFLYDTYHTDRVSTSLHIDTQSIVSPYASAKEIETFDKFPPILRYIIMNQLRGILLRSDYVVKEMPTYYFKGTDKYDLLTELSKKTDSVVDLMYFKCGYEQTKSSK